jgi:GGDEF domain-containing protein
MFADQSFDAPVIHVVSESPRLEMLQARLKQAGIRPVPVRGNYLPPDSAPALIDLTTRAFEMPTDESRVLVTIGGRGLEAGQNVIHLSDVSQIATLPARLAIRQRETHRLNEIHLRAMTSEKFGAGPATSPHRSRLLWLGHDAPFLNAVKASLADHQISLVAAISRMTAEDYLINGGFQTVILCPSSATDEAAKLLSSIATLDLPNRPRVVLLLRPELSALLAGNDIAQADQILDLTTDLDELASQLYAACTNTFAREPDTLGLTSGAQDQSTGLVSRDFLESHVEAQMAQADRLAAPLSLISINIRAEKDIQFTARAIKALLRDTDLAARLDDDHICVTLPNTQYRGAVILARRIEESLQRPVGWRVIERRQFHTLKTLLGGLTARTGLSARRSA